MIKTGQKIISQHKRYKENLRLFAVRILLEDPENQDQIALNGLGKPFTVYHKEGSYGGSELIKNGDIVLMGVDKGGTYLTGSIDFYTLNHYSSKVEISARSGQTVPNTIKN